MYLGLTTSTNKEVRGKGYRRQRVDIVRTASGCIGIDDTPIVFHPSSTWMDIGGWAIYDKYGEVLFYGPFHTVFSVHDGNELNITDININLT